MSSSPHPLARLSPRIVPGDGPSPCRLMLLGEGPGKEEDRLGVPFVGASGQLFWSNHPSQFPGILDSLRLPRDQFYITNVVKQRIVDDKDPNPAELAYFLPQLEREIREVQPAIIIAAGGFATRTLLGPSAALDVIHGLPHWSDRYQVAVVPCLHPAAGLHNTDQMAAVYWDYSQAAQFIRGALGLHEVEDAAPVVLRQFDAAFAEASHVGADTESLISGATWCLTASWRDNEAAIIMADDHAALQQFLGWTRRAGGTLFMHHALHDIRAFRLLHPDLDLASALIWTAEGRPPVPHATAGARLLDTMVLAFERGTIDPQGLKALAYRRLHVKMRSYEDVVGPYQRRLALDYLFQLYSEGLAGAFREPEAVPRISDSGRLTVSRPWSLTKRIARILKDADEDPEGQDPVKRWQAIDQEIRDEAEQRFGPMPRADLSHVPFEEAAQYACADAAMTRRLGLWSLTQHRALDLDYTAQIDHGAMPLIERMVANGLPAKRQYFLDLGREMRQLQAETAALLSEVAGRPINPNSADQVAELVFGDLGLESVKSTPGGKPSTGKKALQHLRDHPMVEWILRAREFGKLDDAFCQNIASRVQVFAPDHPVVQMLIEAGEVMDADQAQAEGWGLVHTDLKHTRVKTGRLASQAPNLLAIPTRTQLGNRVRGGFIAPPSRRLATFDLSQMELRILAHLSMDPWLIDIYRRTKQTHPEKSDRDVHIMTAARIWGVPGQDVQKAWRTATKCFHPDTEVLTRRGWVRIPDLVAGEQVVQALPSDRGEVRLEWATPLDVYTQRHPSRQLIHLRNEGMDLRVTPDHRMLGWRRNGRWFVTTPAKLGTSARTWANAGLLHDHDRPKYSLPLLRLAVALQADGSIDAHGHVRWGFTKARKIARLRRLLREARLPYTTAQRRSGQRPPITTFRVNARYADHLCAQLDPDKTLPWHWLGLPLEARQVIIEEAQYWDSHARPRRYTYSTTIRKNADVLQALAAVSGRKTRQRGPLPRRNTQHAPLHALSVGDHHLSRGGALPHTAQPYTDRVACLVLPSSFVLVRSAGITTICGQSANFGIAMGMSGKGLAEQMRLYGLDPEEWTPERCDDLIHEILRLWAGVRAFQDRQRAQARRYGYVTDLVGRRYDLPHARCPLPWVREEALRQSYALVIQGSAQGYFKQASRTMMTDLFPDLHRAGVYCQPLLQVHDETLIEADAWAEDIITPRMLHVLASAMTLAVPIEAGSAWGQAWSELEK